MAGRTGLASAPLTPDSNSCANPGYRVRVTVALQGSLLDLTETPDRSGIPAGPVAEEIRIGPLAGRVRRVGLRDGAWIDR